MRVRFLKEVPGLGIGKILDIKVDSDGVTDICYCNIDYLIKEGWVEKIKERTLAEKFDDFIVSPKYVSKLCQITKDHYREIVEKIAKEQGVVGSWTHERILKAIKKG